jgi:hypothetical protein
MPLLKVVIALSIVQLVQAGGGTIPFLQDFCTRYGDVERFNGSYFKSVCFTDTKVTLAVAYEYCQAHGMALLDAHDAELLDLLNDYFPDELAQHWTTRNETSCYVVQNLQPFEVLISVCGIKAYVACEYVKLY